MREPLRYLGGPLRETAAGRNALGNIVRHAESLARRLAELERRGRSG